MKLKNIFKKETKKVVKSEVQSLNKDQLEKVIGGNGDTLTQEPVIEEPLSKKRQNGSIILCD